MMIWLVGGFKNFQNVFGVPPKCYDDPFHGTGSIHHVLRNRLGLKVEVS